MLTYSLPAVYHQAYHELLLRAVPADARRILLVGCAAYGLGARLKEQSPRRQVIGIERKPSAAARAAKHLDRVYCLDVSREDPPLEPGSLDGIIYGDVLRGLRAPDELLARQRRFLGPGGWLLCPVPNVQHHSVVRALLRGNFQYGAEDLLDRPRRRLFTYATFVKLLLDAGFSPELVGAVATPWPPGLLAAARPLLRYLGLELERALQYLGTRHYIFRGRPYPAPGGRSSRGAPARSAEPALSFVACVSDEDVLRANLLSSPCLGPGTPHEVLLQRGCCSAADGLQRGIGQARHAVVVCVRQDVYLPQGWTARFWQQYRRAAATYGPPGVVGVSGAVRAGAARRRVGHVVDGDRVLAEAAALPAVADTLDEAVLAVPRDTPLRFDPRFGFALYGADLCHSARHLGLPAVVVDALCFHNALAADAGPTFRASAAKLARKWPGRLPIASARPP